MPPLVLRWGPVVGALALIFAASSRSTFGGAERVVPDWISHGVEYGVLAFLAARAVGQRVRGSVLAAAAVVLACTAYGITDEIHQSFVPGRECDPRDVVKDLGGSTAGVLVFRARKT